MTARQDRVGSDGPRAAGGTERLVTVARAAALLGVSRRSAWRLIAAGALSAVRVGRCVRIDARALDAFIAKGGTAR